MSYCAIVLWTIWMMKKKRTGDYHCDWKEMLIYFDTNQEEAFTYYCKILNLIAIFIFLTHTHPLVHIHSYALRHFCGIIPHIFASFGQASLHERQKVDMYSELFNPKFNIGGIKHVTWLWPPCFLHASMYLSLVFCSIWLPVCMKACLSKTPLEELDHDFAH